MLMYTRRFFASVSIYEIFMAMLYHLRNVRCQYNGFDNNVNATYKNFPFDWKTLESTHNTHTHYDARCALDT